MLKFIGWTVIVVVGLFVGAVLAVLAGGEERRLAVTDSLREHVLELSDDGRGYHDGRRVWACDTPYRITIEQLESLDGRLQGSSYQSNFLTARMSWFGISLREALARALQLPVAQVDGSPELDTRWLDVDVGRVGGVLGGGAFQWDEGSEDVLQGLLEGYDLTVAMQQQLRPRIQLSAGPGWAEHEQSRRRGRTRSRDERGRIEIQGPLSQLLDALGQRLRPVAVTEGLDTSAWVDVALHWDADDEHGLVDALASQLDLRATEIEVEVDVASIMGEPWAPFERGR